MTQEQICDACGSVLLLLKSVVTVVKIVAVKFFLITTHYSNAEMGEKKQKNNQIAGKNVFFFLSFLYQQIDIYNN